MPEASAEMWMPMGPLAGKPSNAVNVLLVAATGGHLVELAHLADRIPGFDDDAIWVTFDTPQSRGLLADRRHVFVPYTASRDALMTLRNMRVAARLLRQTQPSLVASTGNAIALSFLPLARAFRIPALYIESAARVEGPSVTGRILERIPGVQLLAQYPGWRERWGFAGSVFDDFVTCDRLPPQSPRRVFVTLGTAPFSFIRLVHGLLDVLPADWQVIWQTGNTDVSGLDLNATATMDDRALREEMACADLVVAHAGVGSTLTALEMGKCPLLVPREHAYGEHVDDHQVQIARGVAARNLAVFRAVSTLGLDAFDLAASRGTERRQGGRELMLS